MNFLRKLLISGFILNYSLTSFVSPSFAAQAIVLTDAELDAVHAQGLFLNFDQSFGSVNDVLNPSSPNATQKINAPGVVQTTNPGIQFIQFNTPPKPPAVPPVPSNTAGGTAPILNPIVPTAPLAPQQSLLLNPSQANLPLQTVAAGSNEPQLQEAAILSEQTLQNASLPDPIGNLPNPEAGLPVVNNTASVGPVLPDPISTVLQLTDNLPQPDPLQNIGVDFSNAGSFMETSFDSNALADPETGLNSASLVEATPVNTTAAPGTAPGTVSTALVDPSQSAVDQASVNNSFPVDNAVSPLNIASSTPVNDPTPSSSSAAPVSNSSSPSTASATSVPLNNSPSTSADSALNTVSNIAQLPQTPASPASNIAQPIQLDVFANQASNGQFDVALNTSPTQQVQDFINSSIPNAPELPTGSGSGLPSGSIPEIPDTLEVPDVAVNGGGNNIVNVSDFSQQSLSSLVNINAAGSVVPVILNITVNMNSTVENLTNSNNIAIANYNNFQFK